MNGVGAQPTQFFEYLKLVKGLFDQQNPKWKMDGSLFFSNQELWLGENSLTYPPHVPPKLFDKLPDLTSIDVSNFCFCSYLPGISAHIFGNLKNLKTLDFMRNSLQSLPKAHLPNGIFGSLVNLKHISLGSNHLTSLPDGRSFEMSKGPIYPI